MRFFRRYLSRNQTVFPLGRLNKLFPGRRKRQTLAPALVRSTYAGTRSTLAGSARSKKSVKTITCMIFLAMTLMSASTQAQHKPDQHASVLTAEMQEAITPAKAIEMLKAGNARFVAGEMHDRELMTQVAGTANGQHPYAVVLGCIDSRVPPELVFDQGIGDIFTPRIAGNFVNTDLLGSMEFATHVAGAKLVVVLGHTSCGAVKGACDNVELGNLTPMLENLMPAVHAVDDVIGERNSSNARFVDDVAHMNVKMTIENILEQSPVMKTLVDEGELMVVGAMHDVKTGKVSFMD